jgi:hypothetical protein
VDAVIYTVNFVRNHGLNHRQFKHFLEEIEAKCGDVLYYTKVRWLNTGNVLRRFFNLRAETEIFTNENSKSESELSDAEWILDLTIFGRYNIPSE